MPSSTAPSSPWGRSGGGAEPPNPFLTTYDNFCQRTPLVTRCILTTLSVTYVLSFIFDPTYALSSIPYATVFKFQLYRLITSSLLCTNALSLLFAFLSFGDTGRRMEHGLGSAAMGTLICTLSLLINASYVVLLLLAYMSDITTPNNSGFWPVLLAIIAIECSTAPADSVRRLIGAYEIRTRYYPLLLLGLFTLLGGFHLAYGLGVAAGYAYGLGKLDMIKPAQDRLTQWENGVLINFTSRQGWVSGHSASGSNAWALPSSNAGGSEGGNGGGWSPATFFQGRQQPNAEGSAGSGGPGQRGSSPNPPVEPAGFPTTGGRALGDGIGSSTGTKQRSAAAAVAEAAERRAKASAAASARSADTSDDV